MLSPKETGEYISSMSKMVTICEEGVASLSRKVYDELKKGTVSKSDCKYHPYGMSEDKAVNWFFVIDTLNFCFWSPDPEGWWEITYKGNTDSGYFGLCVAINRAIEKGIDMTDPKVYTDLKLKDLQEILQGDDPAHELPLIKERLDNLHEVGSILLERFQGSFVNFIKECDKSAQKLLNKIVSEFICYKDEAVYRGKKVSFYKRAQILIADIWAWFEGKGIGEFHDINKLTMFADYRVPQVLVHFGVLKYSPEIYEKLKSETVLESGCDEELEIRGCSIEAVERVKNEVLQMLQKDKSETNDIVCNSLEIDYYLWEYRRRKQLELEYVPFHKVISIFY